MKPSDEIGPSMSRRRRTKYADIDDYCRRKALLYQQLNKLTGEMEEVGRDIDEILRDPGLTPKEKLRDLEVLRFKVSRLVRESAQVKEKLSEVDLARPDA
jgi:hypothetical protein